MDFSEALKLVKTGKWIGRYGWNGKGMFVFLRPAVTDADPNNGKEDHLPYLCMKTVQGDFVPWLASQTDILADDWQVVE